MVVKRDVWLHETSEGSALATGVEPPRLAPVRVRPSGPGVG